MGVNMNDDIILPRHLQIFLGAIKPVRSRMYSAMGEEIEPFVVPHYPYSYISTLVNPLKHFAHDLERVVGDGMGGVVQRKDASEAAILATVRDFEHLLGDLLAAYREVRTVNLCGEEKQLLEWVVGMYRHTLGEVALWLDELVSALDDPAGALKRRGMPAEGYVEISLELKLTSSPQAALIKAWADRKCDANSAEASHISGQHQSNGIGFWGTLGLVWLGWEIGEHLFGGEDD